MEPFRTPTTVHGILHVTDWQLVEARLHQHFRDKQIRDVTGTRELFNVSPHEARAQLTSVDNVLRVDHETTLQIFQNRDVGLYIYRLFNVSGLFGNLDIQGAWTLRLLTGTLGGTWFTLNIGTHAVAVSMRGNQKQKSPTHLLSVDRLIRDYAETVKWIRNHGGGIDDSPYKKADHAVQIEFDAAFGDAEKIFQLRGMRRALIAYWSDALADLRERSVKSRYARYHSYNAVAELLRYNDGVQNPFDRSEAIDTGKWKQNQKISKR